MNELEKRDILGLLREVTGYEKFELVIQYTEGWGKKEKIRGEFCRINGKYYALDNCITDEYGSLGNDLQLWAESQCPSYHVKDAIYTIQEIR